MVMFNWAAYVCIGDLVFISEFSGATRWLDCGTLFNQNVGCDEWSTRNIPAMRYVYVRFILCHFILIWWTIACDSLEDLDWPRFIFFSFVCCRPFDWHNRIRLRNISVTYQNVSKYAAMFHTLFALLIPPQRRGNVYLLVAGIQERKHVKIKKSERKWNNFLHGIFSSTFRSLEPYRIHSAVARAAQTPAIQNHIKPSYVDGQTSKDLSEWMCFVFWWYTQLCMCFFFTKPHCLPGINSICPSASSCYSFYYNVSSELFSISIRWWLVKFVYAQVPRNRQAAQVRNVRARTRQSPPIYKSAAEKCVTVVPHSLSRSLSCLTTSYSSPLAWLPRCIVLCTPPSWCVRCSGAQYVSLFFFYGKMM